MSTSPGERRSYAQRRELFKHIWNATMLFDEGDAADAKIKPNKVIKTLRLEGSSHDKAAASVRKKRLKNLRTVCNKILAFCDSQEQDDHAYYQTGSSSSDNNRLRKSNKTKRKKFVKKVKKSSSPSKEKDSEKKDTNIGDAAVPIHKARKLVKKAVPMVASHSTNKLTSTRSPTRRTTSPSPIRNQKQLIKKSSNKKKKFPENTDLRQLWKEATGRKDWEPKKYSKLQRLP